MNNLSAIESIFLTALEKASHWLNRARALLGEGQLKAGKWAEAEATLRECVKQHTDPGSTETFHLRGLLGGSLLGQKKYAEAEPLLVQAYEGMAARTWGIRVWEQHLLPEALVRLVRLYDAWGKLEQAAKWRKELEARRPSQSPLP
jgi:hypothetical protein